MWEIDTNKQEEKSGHKQYKQQVASLLSCPSCSAARALLYCKRAYVLYFLCAYVEH